MTQQQKLDLTRVAEKATKDNPHVTVTNNGRKLKPNPLDQTNISPEKTLQNIQPGDMVLIHGKETEVEATSILKTKSPKKESRSVITQIGFGDDLVGKTAILYICRDPYLLNIMDGEIWEIEPSAVQRLAR